MKAHTALIVDDERIARTELAYLLRDHHEIEVIGQAATLDEAVQVIERDHPDLILLDVQLQGATGFDLYERIAMEAHVIFVTAFDEFALRAFEVNALDYLTKPVHPQRLRRAIERYLAQVNGKAAPVAAKLDIADTILLTIDRVPRFVKLANLDCILAEGDYTQVIYGGHAIGLVLKSLKEWEQLLPVKNFCRIQRSVIINCEQVVRFEQSPNGGYEVYMRNLAKSLTMSRRCAREFRSRFAI